MTVVQTSQHAPASARAKHTKLALSKALNVTINRAPMQASLRKMLQRSSVVKRRLSGDDDELLEGFLDLDGAGDDDNSKADEALAQVILGVCEDAEVRSLSVLWCVSPLDVLDWSASQLQ